MKTQSPPFENVLREPGARKNSSAENPVLVSASVQNLYGVPEHSLRLALQKFTNEPFLKTVREMVEQQMPDGISVEDLAKSVYYSRIHFFRKIKKLTGQSPSCFVRYIRLNKALELLCTTEFSISEIAYSVGFTDPKYFTRVFVWEFKKNLLN
ncbi:MAG: helix-turn-helix transcriptional regulator [Lewinellaceae bacterium]|nr:helix-turn-helix transcriptional regulator [Lewinellaceae bacterium]